MDTPEQGLSGLSEVARNPTVSTAVEGVRRLLGLDLAYATLLEPAEQVVLHVEGDALAHLGPAVRAEHERWDGAGYPDGLAAQAIPIASRIVLACDAHDAMITDRPYREALDHEAAVGELVTGSASQFDPEVVSALLEVLADESQVYALRVTPVGRTVRGER